MAIYRGVGGAGDATNDATSQAIIATQAAVAAAASEAAAASSALSAAASATLAQTFEPENFATAAQGALADSAIQPEDLATVATSGSYTDLTGKPTLGSAAYAATSDFATAAQGVKADSALQPSAIGSTVQGYDSDLATLASGNVGSQLVSYGQYGVGFKNRIINGAMMIDQRSNGASTTITPTGGFIFASCDRWSIYSSVASKVSVQQNAGSVTPPAGFNNYLGITTVSAYSPASGELFALTQQIEGFNVADLSWGTANAAAVTLSFWVRSSLTGTFGGCLMNGAYDRSYPFSYTISSANTWTRITLTVDGDTTGTWLTDNGMGIRVSFSLGAGSTIQGTANAWASGSKWSVTGETQSVGTNGATFYVTGVQLEKGSTATSFDYRPYGAEFALCQRYYHVNSGTYGAYHDAIGSLTYFSLPYATQMRATPTISLSASGGGGYSSVTPYVIGDNHTSIRVTASSAPGILAFNFAYTASAEL